MTIEKTVNRPSATIEQAMNQVLEAERRAEQAVAECERDAVKIRQAAQQQAKRIATRTNERLATCHMRCNAKITREIKARERTVAETQIGESTYRLEEAALASVVEVLALELTGVAPSGENTEDR